jgi:hypothetical protein
MMFTTKSPTAPDDPPVDGQRKLRRAVLGGSVGTSVLLGVVLALAGPGETAPAAAPPSENPVADLPPGAEAYPIPAQAAAELPAAPAVEPEAAPAPARSPAPDGDSAAGKSERNHRHAATRSLDARGRGVAAAALPEPEAPSVAPAPVVKKRLPLVDDQSRVPILE